MNILPPSFSQMSALELRSVALAEESLEHQPVAMCALKYSCSNA